MATTTGISFDGVNDTVLKTWTGKTNSSDKKFTVAAWFEVPTGAAGELAIVNQANANGGFLAFGLTGVDGFQGIFPAQRPYVYLQNDNGNYFAQHGGSNIVYGTKYFLMVVYDSAQAVQANRLKVWFGPYNGTVALISGWTDLMGGANLIALNDPLQHGTGTSTDTDEVGSIGTGSTFYKGKTADVYWLDNVALADPAALLSNYASAAAPGTYSGSYGNTGYHLDFSNAGSLGADSSGNANNFTPAGGPTQLTGYFASGGTTLTASAGSYAITGTSATLRKGKGITAAAGSYAVTGTAATLRKAAKLAATAGSYSVTGTAAGLKLGRKIAAVAGSYTVTGTAATLRRARITSAAAGSYAVTGTAAALRRALKAAAGVGSYAVTGTAATLRHGWVLIASAGSYAVTGTAAALSKSITGKSVVAGVGSYSITGTAATLRHSWIISASAGSYAVTGTSATLVKTNARSVSADPGLYAISGTDATLQYGQAAVTQPIITGGGRWREHRPNYRIHPEYDDTKPQRKKRANKVGPVVVLEPAPVIVTGIVEVKPAWDALVEIQQQRDEAERVRIKKLRALLLADDEWLMSA